MKQTVLIFLLAVGLFACNSNKQKKDPQINSQAYEAKLLYDGQIEILKAETVWGLSTGIWVQRHCKTI